MRIGILSARFLVFILLVICAPSLHAAGRQFYVNNERGDDQANGSEKAPVKTLAKGVTLLSPGDTMNLVPTPTPYHETLQLNDVTGTPGNPIVFDGHGATITGGDPLRDDWVEAGQPGLYKSDQLLAQLKEANDDTKLQRMFFVFDGVQQRMGRTSKGVHPAFKKPDNLQPGEWTYDADTRTFYVKVKGTLAEAKVEAPYRQNGVALRGRKGIEHIVIRNLICVHVLNDGFNLHGSNIKAVSFENIAAYENGDDGFSPHEQIECSIDGFWSMGNSTGVGLGLGSHTKMNNLHLEGNFADEYLTGVGGGIAINELRNSVIIASASAQPFLLGQHQDGAHETFDNVLISAPNRKKIEISPKGVLDARRLTVIGATWSIGGTANVKESVIVGKALDCLEGGVWLGDKNIHDIVFNERASKGNTNSSSKPVPSDAALGKAQPFPGIGADPAEFKIPSRPVPNPAAGKFVSLR